MRSYKKNVKAMDGEGQDNDEIRIFVAYNVHHQCGAAIHYRSMSQQTEHDRQMMQMAIDLSIDNVRNGGGPFGAVIEKEGMVVATGVNRVTAINDPTAHAEVMAIREACRSQGTFRLTGCTCYASCEPCPMCLAALYWAGVEKIVFANTKEDAEAIGFSDRFIYQQIQTPVHHRSLRMTCMMREEAQKAFRAWEDKTDKTEY